uniref:Uncharacterized protein n=1 Tax=viral metagenome TaxID=1070528 RepID=A0A6C0JR15_9ZZZZ
MTLVVGVGIYRGITWEIYRYVNKCSVAVTSIFLLDDKHSREYMDENNVCLNKDGKKYQTDILYKRKDCREIARILCVNLWRIYDKYLYGL